MPRTRITNRFTKEERKFFEFIRGQFCCMCGGYDIVDQYGDIRVTVSHVIARGSQHRNDHFGNVVPHCMKCHRKFEDSGKSVRIKQKPLAQEYYEKFLEENHDK